MKFCLQILNTFCTSDFKNTGKRCTCSIWVFKVVVMKSSAFLHDYTAVYPKDRTHPQIRDSFLSCYITNISSKLWDKFVLLNFVLIWSDDENYEKKDTLKYSSSRWQTILHASSEDPSGYYEDHLEITVKIREMLRMLIIIMVTLLFQVAYQKTRAHN